MAKASKFTKVSVLLSMQNEEAVALRLFIEHHTPHTSAMTATQEALIVDIHNALKHAGVQVETKVKKIRWAVYSDKGALINVTIDEPKTTLDSMGRKWIKVEEDMHGENWTHYKEMPDGTSNDK